MIRTNILIIVEQKSKPKKVKLYKWDAIRVKNPIKHAFKGDLRRSS